jgi:uncharacterized delta-60 repeat protein
VRWGWLPLILAACSSGSAARKTVYVAPDAGTNAGTIIDMSHACPGTLSFPMPIITARAGEATIVPVHFVPSEAAASSAVQLYTPNADIPVDFGFLGPTGDFTFRVFPSLFHAPGTETFSIEAGLDDLLGSSSDCIIGASTTINIVANDQLSIPSRNGKLVDIAALGDGGLAILTTTRLYRLSAERKVGTVAVPSAANNALAAQPDGKVIVVGGDASAHPIALRFTTANTLDPTWGNAGITTLPPPYPSEVVVEPDGSVYAASSDSIFKLLPNGTLDGAFGSGGVLSEAGVSKLGARPDNNLLVLGHQPPLFSIAVHDPKGASVPTFGTNGIVSVRNSDEDDVFAFTPSGGSLVVSHFIGGEDGPELTRLDSFAADGSSTSRSEIDLGTGIDVAGDAIGRAYVLVADTENFGAPGAIAIIRLTPDGKTDPAFGSDGARRIYFEGSHVARRVVPLTNADVAVVIDDTVLFVKP